MTLKQKAHFFFVILTIILTSDVKLSSTFEVCPSITIQGPSKTHRDNAIRNCSIVLGSVRIMNAELDSDIVFANLVEVTDYVLIFQPKNVKSLDKMFPKLSVIRGDKLFKNYALILFLANSLSNISLKNLVSIKRGSVFISRLYHTCYINSIDWQYMISDKNAVEPSISLINNDCYAEICRKECGMSNGPPRCWNEKDCQIMCPSCANGCNLSTKQCCKNPNCLYCTDNDECVSCKKYRDLSTGSCVDSCPENTLLYEGHSCIPFGDCTNGTAPQKRTSQYHVFENRQCVRECPNGYRTEMSQLKIDENVQYFNQCRKCEDNVCKKDCPVAFTLKAVSDLDAIKNCVRVKQLVIELRTNISQSILEDNLQYLEEITDFLVVIRNRHLTSLKFFKNLRLIRGENLYEKKFSMFIHTNEVLRDLWDYNQTKFSIRNGDLKFFENPEFCFENIEQFVIAINKSVNEADVSYNFNGYRRLTCSSRKIELNFKLEPTRINVSWLISFSDIRRLKGFTLAYVEASNNKTFDPNDIGNTRNCASEDGYYDNSEWNYIYIQHDESGNAKPSISETIEVEPYTRYAIYVKADITFSSMSDNKSTYFTFKNDRAISDINYVYSLPTKPSRVEDLRYEASENSTIKLQWKKPRRPNGVITQYFIVYSMLDDIEELPEGIDVCQFEPDRNRIQYTNIKANFVDEDVNEVARNSSCELVNRKRKKQKNVSDEDKSNLIFVEDDIYNMAFRPSIRRTNFSTLNLLNALNATFALKTLVTMPSTINETAFNYTTSDIEKYFNFTSSFLRLIHRDLIQSDQSIFILNATSSVSEILLRDLKSFTRYAIGVVACQNFSAGLEEYAKKYLSDIDGFKKKNRAFDEYLKSFNLNEFCSKPNLLTVRTLPEDKLNIFNETGLAKEDNEVIFKWAKPNNTIGLIYKYNVKIVNFETNMTENIMCIAATSKLQVILSKYYTGKVYYVQVQAVSTAGEGVWSEPVKYVVPSQRNNIVEIIGVAFGAGILLIILSFLSVYFVCKKYIKSKDKGYFTINTQYYYCKPDEWELMRDHVQTFERIGSGCFGEVFKGKLLQKNNETIDCAVKLHGPDKRSKEKILLEAAMMKRISAPHIVKFFGVVSVDDPVFLVIEYMDKGDLKAYLHKHRPHQELCEDELTTERFYKMAAEIADGMLWLAEHKYVHCDLAARNCLVSKNDIIKIADLGLSKDIYFNQEYRKKCRALLPVRWMAIESLSEGTFTTKSDVWSYGVVIWELSTYGEQPYSGKENEEVIKFVKSGGKLQIPPNSPPKFVTLMEKCMKHKQFERIDFKGILDILEPDLTPQFKASSYYSNEFKAKKKQLNSTQTSTKVSNDYVLTTTEKTESTPAHSSDTTSNYSASDTTQTQNSKYLEVLPLIKDNSNNRDNLKTDINS